MQASDGCTQKRTMSEGAMLVVILVLLGTSCRHRETTQVDPVALETTRERFKQSSWGFIDASATEWQNDVTA